MTPKIAEDTTRIRIHVGKLWRKYQKKPEAFKNFRLHDIGRPSFSQRISVQLADGTWRTYAWSFSKDQVEYDRKHKILIVKDRKAWKIISKLKKEGELKGIGIVYPLGGGKAFPRRIRYPKEVKTV